MRKFLLALALATLTAPLYAQRVNIDLPGLSDRAAETVDVTLDGPMLRLATKFLDNDPDERRAREVVQSLEGIYVRTYEFDHTGEYDRGAVDRIKSQLGPSWKRLVQVKSRSRENVDIFLDMRGDKPMGMLIISAEPKELTLVNLVGFIDVDRLAELEGSFGIPHVTSDTPAKGRK